MRAICLMILVVFATGCATPYLTNRRRDFLDCVNLSAGLGAGAKARVSIFQLGLTLPFDSQKWGLRGGGLIKRQENTTVLLQSYYDYFDEKGYQNLEVDYYFYGAESMHSSPLSSKRGKDCNSFTIMGLCWPISDKMLNESNEVYEIDPPKKLTPAHYLTGIEAMAGFIITFRVGVNPGEILDFGLGLFNVDLYKDDIEKEPDP